MVPEEASNPGSAQPEAPAAVQARPPSRRPRRGHRGRGRRRPQHQPMPEAAEARAEEVAELEERAEAEPQPAQEQEVAEAPEDAGERASAPATSRSDHGERKPSVQRAIEEVNQIVDALRDALENMEEVLEMLEVFERQGMADEREMESLRRALRHLQRPRDNPMPHRGRG